MKTIAIMNRRGGVGKTATAHALGSGLAKRGSRVLFVDLDSQANLTYDLGATAGRNNIFSVLTRAATVPETIIKAEAWDVLPGAPTLAGADAILTETGKEYRLKEALQSIAKDYDYTIIDTPPALGVLAVNALTAADKTIIAAQAEIHSMQGIGLLMESVAAVRQYTNNALAIDGILLTRYNGRAIISQDMRGNLAALAAELNTRLYETTIRECVAVKEAQASRQSIFDYAPGSNAATDYNTFIEEFLKGERA